ncbi:MAG: RidA family protein [Candidatus Dormibacteria bacterium]
MAAERRQVSSGAPWEAVVGYSRAVRAGGLVCVSGTVGRNPDGTVPPGAYAQSRRALEIIAAALEELGGGLEHIIRTRIFVTSMSSFEEVARAHAEALGAVRPATSMIEVARLVDDAFVVEIEADAVLG